MSEKTINKVLNHSEYIIRHIRFVDDMNELGYKIYLSPKVQPLPKEIILNILIDNYQQCCEDWGCLSTHENPQEFIGAHLKKIKVSPYRSTCRDNVFTTLETSNGTLQFTSYTEHDGYYGHPTSTYLSQERLIIIGFFQD
jgi:hypothetical protein